MVDYSKGVIYKIKRYDDENDEMILVGSTCDIIRRASEYKRKSNNPNSRDYNIPSHQFIRDNGGWSNFVMEKLEDYPCNDDKELKQREEEWRVKLDAKLNTNKAFQHLTNAEIKKIYYQNNIEKESQRKKKYRQNNPEKIKERYENNKEEIQAKRSIKINCDNCNALVSKSHIARHKKSLKCINYSSSGSGATCSSISSINTDGINTDLPITGLVNGSNS